MRPETPAPRTPASEAAAGRGAFWSMASWTGSWMAWGAAVLVAAIAALINVDIVARTFFQRPLRGVAELVTIAMPAIVFLVLPWAGQHRTLMRAGVLLRHLDAQHDARGRALEVLFELVALLAALAIGVVTAPLLWRAWRDDEFLGVAGDFTVPSWPAQFAVVLGCALFCAQAGAHLAAHLRWFGGRARACLLAPPLLLALLVLPGTLLEARPAIGGFAVAGLLVLLALGTPVAVALFAAAAVGIALLKGSAVIAFEALGLAAGGAVSSYVFGAVPLFVLMGLVMGRADIGRDALVAAHWLLRGIAGGLGVATVAANALFAAMTGISIASAAIFGKVAVPPLVEQGYTPRFAVGLVAGSSVLGMLIPPSLLLIVYGLVAEVSINALFIAAIVPGLVLATAFALTVIVVAYRRPAFAIARDVAEVPRARGDSSVALRRLAPIALLGMAVLGGIYGGLFTPTEAGAAGSLIAGVLALAMRRLRLRDLLGMLRECAVTSSAILLLVVAASAFGMMLTLSGIPGALGAAVAASGLGLGGYAVLYLGLLIVLGMVLDSTSVMLIMVPLALPTVQALGGDLVWFGIVTVIGVEIGLLTPPLGLSVFTIKSALDDERISLHDIFLGAAPFAVLMAVLCLVLIAAPGLCRVLL